MEIGKLLACISDELLSILQALEWKCVCGGGGGRAYPNHVYMYICMRSV